MSVTVNNIFEKVRLKPIGPIEWGTKILETTCGVYVVSLSENPNKNLRLLEKPIVCKKIFKQWVKFSENLNVNGKKATYSILQKEINNYWHSRENILYIGESSSMNNNLSGRVNQFYNHKVGWKGPHTGGYWIKLLKNINELYVYYSECDYPRDTEFKMLMYFIEKTTGKSFYDLEDLGKHLPFANLKVDFQKRHNIKGAVPRN